MGRKPCCCKEGLNRGAWTAMEDKILTDYIKIHGEGKWRNVPTRAGLKRCGKSCRLRWLNYLRPDIKRGNITLDEEDLIIRLHKLLGNRWSLIAGRLPGRTDNEIKNYWNTIISKKIQTGHPNRKRTNQSKEKPDHTTEQSSSVDKSSRCTNVFISTPDPLKSQQLDTVTVAQDFVHDTAVGPEAVNGIPLFTSMEDNPSDHFLMDIEMDEKFLFDLLNTDYDTIDVSSLNCNQTAGLFFSEEMLQDSDLQSMSSLLDPKIY